MSRSGRWGWGRRALAAEESGAPSSLAGSSGIAVALSLIVTHGDDDRDGICLSTRGLPTAADCAVTLFFY